MSLKEWAIGAGIVLAIFVGYVGWSRPAVVVDATQVDVNEIAHQVYEAVKQNNNLGAVPVLTSPQDWNGVTTLNEFRKLLSGTSTVASLKVNATSTLAIICRAGGLSFTQEYEIAVGTTPNATSTRSLGKFTVPAGRTIAVVASTTGVVFGYETQEYINMKMGTTSGTVVSSLLAPTGGCSYEGIASNQ